MTQSEIITECQAFAAEFPTANVKRAIALAEAGRVDWADIYGLFAKATTEALAEVGA